MINFDQFILQMFPLIKFCYTIEIILNWGETQEIGNIYMLGQK